DRLLEFAIRTVALADLLERLLALHGVEPAREHVALAALVAVPELGGRVVVDHAGDVDRQRVERFHRAARLTAVVRRRQRLIARGPRQPVREPASAAP